MGDSVNKKVDMSEEKFQMNSKLADLLKLEEIQITKSEALDQLAKYLFTHTLYNPKDPMEVILGTDPLADVFGVRELKIWQIRRVLERLMVQIPKAGTNCQSAVSCLDQESANAVLQTVSSTENSCGKDTAAKLNADTTEPKACQDGISSSQCSSVQSAQCSNGLDGVRSSQCSSGLDGVRSSQCSIVSDRVQSSQCTSVSDEVVSSQCSCVLDGVPSSQCSSEPGTSSGARSAAQSRVKRPLPLQYCRVTGSGNPAKRCILDMVHFTVPPIPDYDSGAETDLSIQSKETVAARDSEGENYLYDHMYIFNDDSNSEMDDDDNDSRCSDDSRRADDARFSVEFEVRSLPSTDGTISDTDSDVENVVCALIVNNDSDVEFWADEESHNNESSSDSEMSHGDKWRCKMCGTKNIPQIRNCRRCWSQRVDWLPDKSNSQPATKRPLCRRKPRSKRKRAERKAWSNSTEDICSTAESQSQETLPSSLPDGSSNPAEQVCPLCFQHPKTGIIGHGRTSHQFCCYKCAKNLEARGKNCPMCQRRIKFVTRNFPC